MWAYDVDLRHKYLDALSKLERGELVKNREASFHSLRNIFLHMINSENCIFTPSSLAGEAISSHMTLRSIRE